MAVYVIQSGTTSHRGVERKRFEVVRDGDHITGVNKPTVSSMEAYRVTAIVLRDKVARWLNDPAPVFAASADDQECAAFAEMLNA